MKSYRKSVSIFLLLFIFLTLLFTAADVRALSCARPPMRFVAICQSGQCQDGFEVKYIRKGNMCNTRPLVHESPENLQEIFSFLAKETRMESLSDGIYQANSFQECVMIATQPIEYEERLSSLSEEERAKEEKRWNEYCAGYYVQNRYGEPALFKLSSDTSKVSLDKFLADWKKEERQGFQKMLASRWGGVAIMVLFTALALIYAWKLIFRSPTRRQGLSKCVRRAVPFQIFLVLIFAAFLCTMVGGHTEWVITLFVVMGVLALAFVSEITCFIVYKLKKGREEMRK